MDSLHRADLYLYLVDKRGSKMDMEIGLKRIWHGGGASHTLGSSFSCLTSCSFVPPGNIVEWCRPHDIDLEGVEFKSMASGSHRVQSDFM
ncbi:hypothetical protein XELAEV_18003064mg [Xenopus laevis]|uniref:Uncharacterized protein n=1 Tax=Xenopus laevis TaxID=8355 RepID=A0A974GY75_XENLA|nr:hypothetical protein XELAEV_18003064mg [Xenopus laevis]